ncbi:MAG: TauD/TfdA family dioxygenase [SAR324 cluster bacterium]|nr:TauD/TfdA family dioxygenase [SAR324 cluster bacterium]
MDNSVHQKYSHIDVHPVSGALGAEITGVDISLPLDAEVVSEIRKALLNHLVIFFQNQVITPQQQLNFAEQFGLPIEYPQLKGLPECPLVTEVIKLEHETMNFGGVWHSDTTYLQQPPMASMLYAIEIPPYGGDTLFSNQYMAYETLSDGLKKTLSELVAVNTSSKPEVSMTREDRMREAGMELNILSASHPAVRTHPETGSKALYVNKAHTTHFKDWTELESKSLLEFLFHHQVRTEFTCRFSWEKNSLAFWDNRCVQHNPENDYQGFRRIMHRVTIAGDKPY